MRNATATKRSSISAYVFALDSLLSVCQKYATSINAQIYSISVGLYKSIGEHVGD
jgi:hypothetical protein